MKMIKYFFFFLVLAFFLVSNSYSQLNVMSYNGFEENAIVKKRIDYIFVKNIQVLSYFHIDDRRQNNNYISDHLPVFAKLTLSDR